MSCFTLRPDLRANGLPRLLCLVGLLSGVSTAALATTTLPEVLLVVDTSGSMQYRVGADELPICGSADPSVPDQRSRWNAVREMIGGSFASFTCGYEGLPVSPEVTSPPVQSTGVTQCIPGLAASIGSKYSAGGSADSDVQTGSATWLDTADPSGNLVLNDALITQVAIPWMRFNLANIAAKQAVDNVTGEQWVGASVKLEPAAVVAPGGVSVVLVLMTADPTSTGPKAIVCEADIVGRQVVSLPAPVVMGQPTVLTLTDSAVSTLRAMATAGTKNVGFAIVPIGTVLTAPCNALLGTPSDAKVVWTGASAASRPRLDVVVGLKCPDEGPGKHSTAFAVQNDGTTASKATGLDGLLTVFGPLAKFALLAEDGMLNKAATAQGGFSFGSIQSSIWGDINSGLADPYLVGTTSVAVTGPDTAGARSATESAIQQALANMRPNGPTPLGTQLADTYDYLFESTYKDKHFRSLAEDPINGDPYLSCRPHIVVVFSDGGANLHTGGANDGRAYAVQQAGRLYTKGVQVFVLAVGFPRDANAAGPTDEDLQFLDDVAAAGGTQQAVPAQTPQAAVAALAPAIAKTSVVGEVLTRPLYTHSTGLQAEVEHVFSTMSVFDISQPLRTRGVLEQRIFKCGPECKAAATPNRAQVCKIVDYQKRLLERTIARRLYTHAAATRVDADSAHLSATDLGILTVGVGPHLVLQPDTSCVTTGGHNLSVPAERDDFRDHVLATLRAVTGTCRQNFPLGAPARAQPALIEPARRLPLRDPTFLSYANTNVPTTAQYSDLQMPGSAGRPTMLFVATHDGLLHAFRTDADPTINVKDMLQQGDEMWAWLPRFNLIKLSQMKLVTSAAASTLGGAISAGHVLLNRATASASDTAKNWRAVVVVGAGEAGSGYTALDVTAPDDPQLLWEITPNYHCFATGSVAGVAGPQCVPTTTYQALGRSTAKAAIASLFFARDAEVPGEHAVAIIPMGKAPGEATVANLGTEGIGDRGVFIVDLATGALVKAFKTNDLVLTGMPMPVADTTLLGNAWTDIACYNGAPGQITTRCFQGDSKGVLWRLDLASKDPSQWKMSYFFDAYGGADAPASLQLPMASPDRAPIVSPPALALTQDGRLNIVFGAGGSTEDATLTRRHLAYSLTEVFKLAGDGTAAAPSALRNWVKEMDDYERFVGPPLIFAFNAYWSSYTVVKTGACDIGSARLWGGRFDRPKTPSDVSNLQGAFPDPAAPALLTHNLEVLELGAYEPSPVDVQPVPACSGSCSPTDAKCVAGLGGQLGGARPQYQLGVQVAGNVQGQYQKPKAGVQPQVGTITRDIPQPRTAAVVTGWDLLLD